MLDIILFLTTPGGTIPQIGDNDDGRLLILSGYPDWDRHDHRYLLGLGAVIFDRGDYKIACGECPEEVFWLYGEKGVKKFNNIIPDKSPIESRAFPDAGLYVIRNDERKDYALIKAGNPLSIAPRAHCHNDSLGIELWLKGNPVLVDPGTYCYTSDINDRNYFRSTKAHNTMMVDNQEINSMTTKPFTLSNDVNCKTNLVKKNENNIILESKRYNKVLTEESVTCNRKLIYDIEKSFFLVRL